MEIANVCYANVAGDFAMFTDESYRGPNFKWENFPDYEAENADLWVSIHGITGNKTEVVETAKRMAREIAERLVQRAGLN